MSWVCKLLWHDYMYHDFDYDEGWHTLKCMRCGENAYREHGVNHVTSEKY